jgi:hypothetical protein
MQIQQQSLNICDTTTFKVFLNSNGPDFRRRELSIRRRRRRYRLRAAPSAVGAP